MNFETWVSHMNESVKEDELNRILDKMSDGKTLTEIEKKFLSMFSKTDEDDYKDFQYLTKNDAFEKIKNILSEGRKIICDLYEKNKVGIEIVSVYNQFDSESCYIVLNEMKRQETSTISSNKVYLSTPTLPHTASLDLLKKILIKGLLTSFLLSIG
jgi:hypothetical protein